MPAARAAEVPIPEAPTRFVTDRAGMLPEGARRALDRRLEAYQAETGRQVLVWIGTTTGDTPIEDFAVRAFEAWRVGRKGIDDGLVLFVLAEDRKIRIEVGYGLEPVVTDAVSARIIRDVMVPRLRAGDAPGAIAGGVDALLAALSGETTGEGAAATRGPPDERATGRTGAGRGGPSLGQLVIGAVLLIGFLILLVTNPTLAIWLLWSLMGSGRGGGIGGGGGGGGFRGGGGRSGGGGATGGW